MLNKTLILFSIIFLFSCNNIKKDNINKSFNYLINNNLNGKIQKVIISKFDVKSENFGELNLTIKSKQIDVLDEKGHLIESNYYDKEGNKYVEIKQSYYDNKLIKSYINQKYWGSEDSEYFYKNDRINYKITKKINYENKMEIDSLVFSYKNNESTITVYNSKNNIKNIIIEEIENGIIRSSKKYDNQNQLLEELYYNSTTDLVLLNKYDELTNEKEFVVELTYDKKRNLVKEKTIDYTISKDYPIVIDKYDYNDTNEIFYQKYKDSKLIEESIIYKTYNDIGNLIEEKKYDKNSMKYSEVEKREYIMF